MGHQAARFRLQLGAIFHFGVGNGDLPVPKVGLTKNEIGFVVAETVFEAFRGVEPYQGEIARAVAEYGFKAFFPADALGLYVHDAAAQLHVGHSLLQGAYGVYLAAVDIFIGKGVEQVAERVRVQVLREDFCTHRPYAFQVFDIGEEGIGRHIL